MTRFLRYCFDKWWRPVLFWFFTCCMFGLSQIVSNRILENIAGPLLAMGLVVIFIASIYQFTQRKWLTGILDIGLLGGTIFVLFVYVMALFFIDLASPDPWADNLQIPAHLPVENPIDLDMDEHRPDSMANRVVNEMDFQLYNSFQPGLYEYDFWVPQIEPGTIYLKAYEVTQEYALSTDRLPKHSAIAIDNPTEKIVKFSTTSHFTIYEGDWGKPYAARFEVWFKPENGSPERKLMSKIYKVEGWMR